MSKKLETDFKYLLDGGHDFVKVLKFILDAAGWSLSRVAAEAGVDQALVSNVIRSQFAPTVASRRVRYIIRAALLFDPWEVG